VAFQIQESGDATERKAMQRRGDPLILVVNPGSTSTRVAVFRGDAPEREASLPAPGQGREVGLWEELELRLQGILAWLDEDGVGQGELEAVVGRGGLLRPLEGGTYRVTDAMVVDAREGRRGSHASNLGCALARALAEGVGGGTGSGIPSYVVDPVSTDEFGELARYSGLREIRRASLSHALSIHALVREVCQEEGRGVEGSRFVVGHLGGGISICPVVDGRIVDANNANSGGPFSPTRAGGLPTQELLDLAFSREYGAGELKAMTVKKGGLTSYLGTSDALEVERMIDGGDEEARRVYQAMAYQIAKEIGSMATVLKGTAERILLTGGLAASGLLMGWVRERVDFLAPVEIRSGIGEMKALALGALGCLRGDLEAKEY
jgi:butyrate kinase